MQKLDMPWADPFKVDLSLLKAIDPGALMEVAQMLVRRTARPSVVGGTVVAGAAGLAFATTAAVLLSQAEAILQLVGVVAAVQFLTQQLLSTSNRRELYEQIK